MPGRLKEIRHLALDLDGTLYRGGELFPWTPSFLDALRELGLGRSFVTNNSSRSRAGHAKHLQELGIDAAVEEVFTSTMATIELLRRRHPAVVRIFVLGTPELQAELAEAGFAHDDERPQAVLVGFDTTLEYTRLCRAAYWIARGLPYLATHPDKVCPTDEETVLVDCGAICACLERATGREPDAVAGKPKAEMLAPILETYCLAPRELAVVGDRLYTDVRMASAAGAFGVLVLSGETTRDDLARSEDRPNLLVEHVGELAQRLREARG